MKREANSELIQAVCRIREQANRTAMGCDLALGLASAMYTLERLIVPDDRDLREIVDAGWFVAAFWDTIERRVQDLYLEPGNPVPWDSLWSRTEMLVAREAYENGEIEWGADGETLVLKDG